MIFSVFKLKERRIFAKSYNENLLFFPYLPGLAHAMSAEFKAEHGSTKAEIPNQAIIQTGCQCFHGLSSGGHGV